LIEGGKERLEGTNEFKSKVDVIKRDVRDKYSRTLLNERNWTRRIVIVIRREIEIRKRISELSSLKNLHLGHRWQM
jgi:hypothetical protein